jgi:hypothetical protein
MSVYCIIRNRIIKKLVNIVFIDGEIGNGIGTRNFELQKQEKNNKENVNNPKMQTNLS